MKIKSLILSLVAVAMFAACDVVPENDRLVEVELEPSERTVLLVEFTGCRCVNCPGAAMVAHDMIDLVPENIVVVGMHPADFVYTTPFDKEIDFRTSEAMDYLSFYGGSQSTGLPVGVVNGREFDGTYLQGSSKWTAQVLAQRAIAPNCLIDLEHSVDGNNHTVTANLTPKNAMNSVSLVFWLVESNIVAEQSISGALKDSYLAKNPDAEMTHSSVKNYVHNHVFRGSLNGLWGAELGVLTDVTTNNCTFSVDEKYVVDNCSVVAVLVDTETKEVIQAAEIALGAGAH